MTALLIVILITLEFIIAVAAFLLGAYLGPHFAHSKRKPADTEPEEPTDAEKENAKRLKHLNNAIRYKGVPQRKNGEG